MSEMNGELKATESSWADTMSDQWTVQAEVYGADDARVEFGGFGAVAVGASFWGKLKGLFSAAAKGVAKSGMVKDALNSYSPGLGDAAEKGMKLVEAGNAGSPEALAQLKAIADVAAAGDPNAAKTNDMLKVIAEARKSATAEVAAVVGASAGKTTVIMANGKRKSFKTRAAAEAYVASHPGSLLPGAKRGQRPGQQRGRRPATTQNVAQAMNRLPPQQRPQLAGMLQQAQMQGRAPVAMPGQPAYGTPAYWAWQQQQGYPYGAQPGQSYGYGVPYGMQQPYGGMYADEGYLEQSDYYGSDDEELAAAFAADESFPDEGIAGENSIQYTG